MLSFGLSNLRRLKLVPPIELKPITILVGRNSSGKSSFLRAFPLLRQSLMTRTSSPILWYGDLVDFGSFDISVSGNSLDKPNSFSFVIDQLSFDASRSFYWHPRYAHSRGISDATILNGVHFDVSIVRSGERTRISRIFVRIDDPKLSYEIVAGEDSKVISLKLNGDEVSELFKPIKFQISPESLLPELSAIPDETKKKIARSQSPYYFREPNEFVEPIKKLLSSRLSSSAVRR